ncbi:hypothetical protein GCM10010299_64720 [Streptomyces tanashiensis]|nr:hypothetical protein GCM10010299_64720 [Streptomyces tanashiensis]
MRTYTQSCAMHNVFGIAQVDSAAPAARENCQAEGCRSRIPLTNVGPRHTNVRERADHPNSAPESQIRRSVESIRRIGAPIQGFADPGPVPRLSKKESRRP